MEDENRKSKLDEQGALEGKSVSRREFLKIAGIAGAAVGAGAGLGGLIAACGDGATTTTAGATATTAGATTTTAGATTTTVAASTTTVSTGPEVGREVKLGFVAPITGGLAMFGIPDNYCVERATEGIGDGIICADGKKHPVSITLADSQSLGDRSAQVAGDLINNTKVDILLAASTADTVVPAAVQAETFGVPCLASDCPWESFVLGTGQGDLTKTFKWAYNVFWGAEDVVADFLDMWSQVPNNKVIGCTFTNDTDGNALGPLWMGIYKDLGYTVVDQSGFDHGTEDFTSIISAFKKAGCEIGTGVMIPPDFTNFWKQAIQQGWTPKIGTYAKPILFPTAIEALGDIGIGLTTEEWWSPAYPFTSPLLNETCQQFADEFEKRTNQQWTQPLMHFLVFEWAVDVLKRTTNLDDKEEIIKNVASTKMDTICGPVDFSAPVDPVGTPPAPPFKNGPGHVHPNVWKTPVVGGQWHKGTEHPYEIKIVSNASGAMVPLEEKIEPYTVS